MQNRRRFKEEMRATRIVFPPAESKLAHIEIPLSRTTPLKPLVHDKNAIYMSKQQVMEENELLCQEIVTFKAQVGSACSTWGDDWQLTCIATVPLKNSGKKRTPLSKVCATPTSRFSDN
jgi:hypothetical protein